MRVPRSSLTILLALVVFAVPAFAQRPQTREGVNVSFGFGGGSAGLGCSGCVNRQSGTLFYINVGGTLSPRLTLGGEINGFDYVSNQEELTLGSLMAVAHFYPEPSSGFFLTGGAGLTSLAIIDYIERSDISATGFGVELGLGYDVRLGKNFSLTPNASYVKGFSGQVSYNGITTPNNVNPDYVQLGLGFTWH